MFVECNGGMQLFKVSSSVFVGLALVSLGAGVQARGSEDRPLAAYRAGDIDQAKALYREELERAKKSGSTTAKWTALFRSAWFYHELGDGKKALALSNEALVYARRTRDPFRIGRTLSWIGWSYASMGAYPLAIKFYEEAIRLGAPKGKVVIPAVWGLATQELGAVYLRMGDKEAARRHLNATVDFAMKHGILTGVAEGGAHLAELYLLEGNYGLADTWARRAVEAAVQCDCSPNNISRAKTALARVMLDKARVDPASKWKAKGAIEESLRFAKAAKNLRYVAESELLLSRVLPETDFS